MTGPAPWERQHNPDYQVTEPLFTHQLHHQPTERIELPVERPVTEKDGGQSRLLASSGSIAIATLTSRITGFLKLTSLTAVLGGGMYSSYTTASVIPNMISELVLGAVLTAIVVPVLVRAEREDPDGGAAFVRRLFTAALTLLTVACVLALVSAPFLTTHVFLPEDGKVNTSLTTALAFLLLPAILFYGMTALLTAILNTRQVFKPGAWAPVLNNLTALAVLCVFYLMPGEISLDPVRMGDPKLLVLGIGLTLGVVVQVLTLLPAIRREGIDLRPLWGVDARLKQFAGMGAAIIIYVMISQVGLIITNRIAAGHDKAGPGIYANAWSLLQLPYGVLGVTVLTAIMPRLSRNAADDDTPAVVDDLGAATRLTMIAMIPIVGFLTLMGPQIGIALFAHGRNTTEDAMRLGETAAASAFTLIPYALVLIHLRVFYARQQAWTPTWIILGITGVKLVLSLLAPLIATNEKQVVMLLGVANGLGFGVGAIIGGLLLGRSLGDLRMANVGRTLWRVVLASAAGGVAMLIVDRALELDRLTTHYGWWGAFLRVGVGALFMLGFAFAIMRVAGIPEIMAVTVAVSRRLGLSKTPDTEPAVSTRRPYDPLMDAETMILPVIRADAVGNTGVGQFPYPVRQTDTGSRASAGAYEGARVSDEGIPPGRRSAADLATAPARNIGAADEDRVEHVVSQPEPNIEHGPPDGGGGPPPPPPPPIRGPMPRGPKLIPGASVAGGRYRLLAAHGGARGLMFWQALDIKLDREVALTFVDAEQRSGHNNGEDGPQAILSRTLRLGRISSPGLARVLDVVRGSSGGIVVAEWTPGRSLREMADTRPSPIGAARAIAALAAASELTHRSGGALSIDHPDRVRISVAGDAVLAFPATLSDADVQSDVRGLGAMLYALILARWPLASGGSSGTVGGLRPADTSSDGTPIEPRTVRPEVPFEISAVAVRALEANQGVRTAATLQHVLEQASVIDQKTEMLPSLRVGQRATASGHTLADPEAMAAEKARSNRMMLILATLGTVAVILLGLVGWWLANLLTGGSEAAPLSSANLGLTTSNTASSTATPAKSSVNAALGPGVPVPASSVTVFSPKGTPDNPSMAKNVLDNNPSTTWKTDSYFQPFPTLKTGVGLLAELATPATLASVSIDSPSAGTTVEIRSSPTDSPTLDQTQVIGRAVLKAGMTKISVRSDQPVHYVLIWITRLAHTSDEYESTLADVHFTAGV